MYRLMKIGICGLLVGLLQCSPVVAAMTCVDGAHLVSPDKAVARLVVTCTFDTTPGTAVDDLPSGAQLIMDQGYYAYNFKVLPGATGPTDNSDLQILDGNDFTIISATGNGANVIDNTAKTSVLFGDGLTPGSTNVYPIGDGSPWEITVTNNAVNSSSFSLIIDAVKALP